MKEEAQIIEEGKEKGGMKETQIIEGKEGKYTMEKE